MTSAGPLPRRRLGRTGLDVTVLGFGAMELRGAAHRRPRPIDAADADAVLGAVLDAGINLIDTSIDYGESEASIGRALAHRRHEFVLATKAGCPLDPAAGAPADGPLPHDYRREHIVGGLEQSLRRLRTDHVDVLQLHISPPLPVLVADDVVATLEDLRAQGKVRFVGISSRLPEIVDHLTVDVFDTYQVPYSALDPTHEPYLTAAAARGAGVIVRGGVAKGAPGAGHGDAGLWAAWDAAGLDELLGDETRTTFLLRHTISNPALSTTIVGTADVAHVHSNVAAAARGPLDDELVAEVDRRLAAAGVVSARTAAPTG